MLDGILETISKYADPIVKLIMVYKWYVIIGIGIMIYFIYTQ